MHLANNIALFPNGVVGGLVIGSSATLFMYLAGKITGISGIAENVVRVSEGDEWSVSYLIGLGTAGLVYKIYMPEVFGEPTSLSLPAIVAAGVLTGFGTRLGGGCTSGHGLCGMSRASPRSFTAVMSFMVSGAITAYFTRSTAWKTVLNDNTGRMITDSHLMLLAPTLAMLGGSYLYVHSKKNIQAAAVSGKESFKKSATWKQHIISYISGMLFGLGLGYSGMCDPERVLKFLDFTGVDGWDPTLAGVLGGGLLVTSIGFPMLHLNEVSTCKNIKFGAHPDNMKIDWKLVIGSTLFGVGWGLAGACPGPALVSLGGAVGSAAWFVPSLIGGILLKDALIA
jgi:hypothetical protein